MPTPDLAGLLTRRSPNRSTTPQRADPARSDQLELAQAGGDFDQRADSVDSPSADTPSPPARVYLQSITVYVPRTVAQRLTAEAGAAGLTRTAFILQAVNATHTHVAKANEVVQPGVADGNLFAVPQAQRPSRSPSVQTTIRVTDDQLAGLNNLAAQAGISRSRVIAACLDLYFHLGKSSAR